MGIQGNEPDFDRLWRDERSYGGKPSRLRRGPFAKPPKDGASRPPPCPAGSGSGDADDLRLGAVPPIRHEASCRAGDGAANARSADQAGEIRPIEPAQVRIPYRMWRTPALDFVVSAGVTYRAKDGIRVDRQSSVYAAGEIAQLSYDAQLTTTQKGCRGVPAPGLSLRSRRALARPRPRHPLRLRRRRGLR